MLSGCFCSNCSAFFYIVQLVGKSCTPFWCAWACIKEQISCAVKSVPWIRQRVKMLTHDVHNILIYTNQYHNWHKWQKSKTLKRELCELSTLAQLSTHPNAMETLPLRRTSSIQTWKSLDLMGHIVGIVCWSTVPEYGRNKWCTDSRTTSVIN